MMASRWETTYALALVLGSEICSYMTIAQKLTTPRTVATASWIWSRLKLSSGSRSSLEKEFILAKSSLGKTTTTNKKKKKKRRKRIYQL